MKRYSGTVVCIGTGPSLTLQQIDAARAKGFTLFGVNLIYQIVPDLAVLFATNEPFWDFYWQRDDGPRTHPCEKWTNAQGAHQRYGLRYIESTDRPGLSSDPTYIHHGHSSGACLVNLAYLMGAERIVLLGYNLRYAPDYSGSERKVGSGPRHYFGEYPSALHHWPKGVVHGVHVGLVEHYNSIARQGLIEIINATPDSALTCFPVCSIQEL